LPAALRLGLAGKHAWVVKVSQFLCLHPHPVATGSPTEHIFPTLFPKSGFAASNYHASAAFVLESGRIGASLGKGHFPTKMVQNGARMDNGMYTTPPPNIFLTICLFMTRVPVMHG